MYEARVARAYQAYQEVCFSTIATIDAAMIQLLWAKVGDPMPSTMVRYHPLICHMVDTAMVVQCLWNEALPRQFRDEMSLLLGGESQARATLCFFSACHDLGKASPGFVRRWTAARTALESNGLSFPRPTARAVPHGYITALHLREELERDGVPRALSALLGAVLGGHHGLIPTQNKLDETPRQFRRDMVQEAESWRRLRAAIYMYVKRLTEAHFDGADWESILRSPSFLAKLAGLTSVADWIASSEDHFPYIVRNSETVINVDSYASEARCRAKSALQLLGWTKWHLPERPFSYGELFRITDLRPLQSAAARLAAEGLQGPSLILIEAPMGEGKTEAAFFLQDRLQAKSGQRGMYFALPTQATSNAMLDRVAGFLEKRYPGQRVNLHLMHASAALEKRYQSLRLGSIKDEMSSEKAAVVAEEWFTPKKRGLLSSFAVGTVDQALVAVLWVKHGFVRLFGLSDKIVVIDEVHAYDVYTSALITRFVEWMKELGSSVILLSATLPSERRRALVSAFGGDLPEPGVAYPRITWVDHAGRSGAIGFGARSQTPISVKRMGSDRGDIARKLVDKVSRRGCAAWICNTVAKSQEVYKLLKPLCKDAGIELDLFHARYPFDERKAIEDRVQDKFGKKSLDRQSDDYYQRPEKAILVATQVVEQSLDLDFDLMVSDVAPIDLILQRCGRMHRHKRDDRPRHMESPTIWLVEPQVDANRVPDFGSDKEIYSEYILLRTWFELSSRASIRIPEDVEHLIELVYTSPDDIWKQKGLSDEQMERMTQAGQRDRCEESEDKLKAGARLLKRPSPDALFLDDDRHDLVEDEPDASPQLQAVTRLCEPSVQIVCAYAVLGGRASLDSSGSDIIDTDSTPSLERTQKLLERSVSLSHAGVVACLMKEEVPAGWRKNALLRHHRLVAFEGGKLKMGRWWLRLDKQLGIVIEG